MRDSVDCEDKGGVGVDKQVYFEYLDALRESAITNMFGAAPYLANAFDLSKQEAREILKEWMETFSERHKETEEKTAAATDSQP